MYVFVPDSASVPVPFFRSAITRSAPLLITPEKAVSTDWFTVSTEVPAAPVSVTKAPPPGALSDGSVRLHVFRSIPVFG